MVTLDSEQDEYGDSRLFAYQAAEAWRHGDWERATNWLQALPLNSALYRLIESRTPYEFRLMPKSIWVCLFLLNAGSFVLRYKKRFSELFAAHPDIDTWELAAAIFERLFNVVIPDRELNSAINLRDKRMKQQEHLSKLHREARKRPPDPLPEPEPQAVVDPLAIYRRPDDRQPPPVVPGLPFPTHHGEHRGTS